MEGHTTLSFAITPQLRSLRDAFVRRGFDLRLVGGAVRDLVRGVEPKDIDLCTDADPIDQMAIYKSVGVPFYETGLAHGTLSVRLGNMVYEITSLRTESNHDGRHATVSYTRDWLADLSRRDLTFNAMALTFDGEIIDPFGGRQDLADGVVRFVGDPDARMQEDYLRILRWLRFQGRIAPNKPLDPETVEAALRNAHGLRGISRERVWMEVSKIISGTGGASLIDSMYDLEIAPAIDLPIGHVERVAVSSRFTTNPVTLMVALLHERTDGKDHWPDMGVRWKWSADESRLARFLVSQGGLCEGEPSFNNAVSRAKEQIAYDRLPIDWVSELWLMRGEVALVSTVKAWEVPAFPVTGDDLTAAGVKPGPEMGQILKRLRAEWRDSGYTATKTNLMALA